MRLPLCLGRCWLCPGNIWPGGAEGFLQLPFMLLGLAGNMSPPCPGSDQLISTESSWHHCYNRRIILVSFLGEFLYPAPKSDPGSRCNKVYSRILATLSPPLLRDVALHLVTARHGGGKSM